MNGSQKESIIDTLCEKQAKRILNDALETLKKTLGLGWRKRFFRQNVLRESEQPSRN